MNNTDTCVVCGRDIPEDSHYCIMCGYKQPPKKQRQIDRIRNMSVEELAEFIGDVYKEGYIDCMHGVGCVEKKEIRAYLESEVDGK